MSEKDLHHIRLLFVRLGDGQLTPEEFQELNDYLVQHPEAIKELAHTMMDQSLLFKRNKQLACLDAFSSNETSDAPPPSFKQRQEQERIEAIEQHAEKQLNAFLEKQAQLNQQQNPQRSKPPRRHVSAQQLGHKLNRYLTLSWRMTVTAAALLALFLTVWAGINAYLQQRIVATLGFHANAVWSEAPTSTELRRGELELQQGYAQLQFKSGAEVLLQAPCQINLISPKHLKLTSGSLTAYAPPVARGFMIETETSRIVDYGTEFGVAVDNTTESTVHVFQGKVSVNATASPSTIPQMLTKGQGILATSTGELKKPQYNQGHYFMRALPDPSYPGIPGKRLDLADLVGAGNGFGTGILNQGIDTSTGQVVWPPIRQTQWVSSRYTLLPALRAVDGVFIPNGDNGPITISSTGITFADCPPTAGSYYEGIINGVVLSTDDGALKQGTFKGIDYGTADHPGLNMHPNAGITFDLQALRESLPGIQIERFTSLCGISENVNLRAVKPTQTDFWVLTDGELRFHDHLSNRNPESRTIDVPLKQQTRFLTLMTTCPGKGSLCWAFFGEPTLALKPIKAN